MIRISEENYLTLKEIDEILINALYVLDKDKTIKEILKKAGKIFNCDRCFISFFNLKEKNFTKIDKYSEYLKSSKIKSLLDYDLSFEFNNLIKQFETQDDKESKIDVICFPNWHEHFKNFSEENSNNKLLREELNIKSAYNCLIKSGSEVLGIFVIHYNEDFVHLNEEERLLIEIICRKFAILIKRAGLIEINKKQTNREILIRELIRKIADTKDIEEIKNYIVKSIGQELNAIRCFIGEYDDIEKNKNLPIKNEYVKSSEIKSFKDSLRKNKLTDASFDKEIFLYDSEKYLKDNKLDEKSNEAYNLRNYNVRSGFSVPIYYNDKCFGIIVIHYDEIYAFKEEDVNFVRNIAEHIGIAINQYNLYNSVEKSMEIEKLLGNIITTVRSTLELDKMLTIICDEVGKAFNVDRASIIQCHDPNDYLNWSVIREYKSSEKVKTIKEITMDKQVLLFWTDRLFNRGKKSHFIENIPEMDLPEPVNSNYKKLELKTMLGISIEKDNDKWGGLFLSNTKKNKEWTEEEIKLLEVVSDQIYTAIKQAKLYEITKKQAENEALLRKVTQTIRGSLDIEETLKIICEEISKIFEVEKVLILEIPKDKNQNPTKPIMRVQFVTDNSIKLHKLSQLDQPIHTYWRKIIHEAKGVVAIDDLDEFGLPDYCKEIYKELGSKSMLCVGIRGENNEWGEIDLHKVKGYKHWTSDEIELLKSIADQIYFAIKQAELYKTVEETAKKEKLLRETILSLLSSVSLLNINDVFNAIVTKAGELFGADRCFFLECAANKNEILPIETYKQYVALEDLKPVDNKLFKKEKFFELVKPVIEKRQILIIQNNDEENISKEIEEILNESSVKSFIGFPITHGKVLLGVLVLHYVKDYKQFNQSEVDTLHIIASQAGVIINQAKLYKKIQETAEREKLLAEIITIIKSNLKLDEVFLIICGRLTQFFDVNKILIAKLDTEEKKLNILNECRKDNKDDKNNYKLSSKTQNYFYEQIIKNKKIIIDDIKKADKPNYLLKDLKLSDIKSFIMVPIIVNANETGAIIIQDNKPNNWEEEDITFLSSVADYLAIVIRDSNLYNQAEFVSNVSHELKTPLSIINGYAEALLNPDKPDEETLNRFLYVIKNNSERLNKLIDNLLFISTIEKKIQSKNMVFEKLKVSDLIENSIQLCNEKIRLKKINIEKSIENIIIRKANIILLQQLIINLITNSINYSEPCSKIKLIAIKKDKEILISVKDEGCGINKEHISNIFERFYRVDKSRNRETGGTGLGLSISKLISEIHGGYITVDSIFGEGSTFTLHLPE